MHRIGIYWHNGRALGHTSRCGTIGDALLRQNNVVVGITGASRGLELLPPEMDVLKLPSYLAYDSETGVKTWPVMKTTKSEFQNIRQNLISTFLRDFGPDVLIVDYSPQVKKGELTRALIESASIKKVLGLRGVLDSPEEINDNYFAPEMVSFIQKYYTSIHVYIDPNVFRLEEYYRVPDSIRSMLKYTGYVTRSVAVTREKARCVLGLDASSRIIVVSFGGGQGTEGLLAEIISALGRIKDKYDQVFLATGPYLEAESFERLRAMVSSDGRLKLSRFLDQLHLWMKACDLFIGSGGYNTLAEVIVTNSNALIIPRQLSEREQRIHSNVLSDLGVVRTLQIEEISANPHLCKTIEMCLAEPIFTDRPILTNGAQRNAELIKSLI